MSADGKGLELKYHEEKKIIPVIPYHTLKYDQGGPKTSVFFSIHTVQWGNKSIGEGLFTSNPKSATIYGTLLWQAECTLLGSVRY